MNTVYRIVRRGRRPHERSGPGSQPMIALHMGQDPHQFRPELVSLGLALLR